MKCSTCHTRGTKKTVSLEREWNPLALRYRAGTQALPNPLSYRETRDKPGLVLGSHVTCVLRTAIIPGQDGYKYL